MPPFLPVHRTAPISRAVSLLPRTPAGIAKRVILYPRIHSHSVLSAPFRQSGQSTQLRCAPTTLRCHRIPSCFLAVPSSSKTLLSTPIRSCAFRNTSFAFRSLNSHFRPSPLPSHTVVSDTRPYVPTAPLSMALNSRALASYPSFRTFPSVPLQPLPYRTIRAIRSAPFSCHVHFS